MSRGGGVRAAVQGSWSGAVALLPKDFLDLVMELRETDSSKYTQRDTPIFTCVQMPMDRILDQLF